MGAGVKSLVGAHRAGRHRRAAPAWWPGRAGRRLQAAGNIRKRLQKILGDLGAAVRLAALHDWPASRKRECAGFSAARAISASAGTMQGLLPPAPARFS